ncbi:MAG: chloride channel protein [Desulfurococcales archaeon]|nr:chloride channel protein [Desulfurococcales archaeon]
MATKRILLDRRSLRHLKLDVLAIIVGVLGGFAAYFLRATIGAAGEIYSTLTRSILALSDPTATAASALLGGLVVGPIVYILVTEARGHGVPEVMAALLERGGRIHWKVAPIKILAASVTIGSGGSAGREGPIAQTGATLGSMVGQLAKLEPHEQKIIVAAGLAAGVAATFNAPLGGALFAIEVLLRIAGPVDAVPIVLASVIGTVVGEELIGEGITFRVPRLPVWRPEEIPLFILHGIILGLAASVWVRLFYTFEEVFEKLPGPKWIRPAIGMGLAGFIAGFFPGLGVSGVGYEGVEKALQGQLAVEMLLLLAIAKAVATGLTVGSGGSGGIFAPSLYIGSMLGYALGLQYPLGDPLAFSLAGMAALFAGAAYAPLTMSIMIPEISGSFTLIAPIMASAGTAYVVSRIVLGGSNIYTIKLERRGVRVRLLTSLIMDSVRVGDIMSSPVTTVRADATLRELERLAAEKPYGGYPVVDDGKLVGIVTRRDLERAIERFGYEKAMTMRVRDIMTSPVIVAYPDETLRQALDKMNRYGVSRLPVVQRGASDRVIGIVTRRDILEAIEKALEEEEG